MVSTMLARRAQFHQQALVSHLTPVDPSYNTALDGLVSTLMAKGADAVQAMQQALGVIYGLAGRQAMMKAFIDNFWLLAVTFLALIPLIFLMRSTGAHKADMSTMH
jgi:DHA2 family multidrug resistance protein